LKRRCTIWKEKRGNKKKGRRGHGTSLPLRFSPQPGISSWTPGGENEKKKERWEHEGLFIYQNPTNNQKKGEKIKKEKKKKKKELKRKGYHVDDYSGWPWEEGRKKKRGKFLSIPQFGNSLQQGGKGGKGGNKEVPEHFILLL